MWRRAGEGGVEEVVGCADEGLQEGPDGTVMKFMVGLVCGTGGHV